MSNRRKLPHAAPQGQNRCDFCSGLADGSETLFGCRDFKVRQVLVDSTLVMFSPDIPVDDSDARRYDLVNDQKPAEKMRDIPDLSDGQVVREWTMQGAWAACAACTPLVIASDWATLLARLPRSPVTQSLADLWRMFAYFGTGEYWQEDDPA
jgi:hypothetical protein